MPRIMEIKVYQFDELSDEAKEKAREWMRQGEMEDFGQFGDLFDFAEEAAKLLGIDFDQRDIKTHGGKTRHEPDIRYSGFYSQGDGASFVATYAFKPGCAEAVRENYPKETSLHKIADSLTFLTVRRKLLGQPDIAAKTSQSGHYSHSKTMHLEYCEADGEDVSDEDQDIILEAMRDFADWIYEGLEQDWDWRLEDEQIEEGIRANEYEFTEDGERA